MYVNSIMPVVAYNPDYIAQPWALNSRLEFIELLYRTSSSNVWLNAIDSAGIPVIFGISNTAPYSFSSWDLSTIKDGNYEIVLHAACSSSVLASAPPRSADSFSDIVAVRLDQQAPFVLLITSPADNTALPPGGMIALLFNEPIQCVEPLTLDVSVSADVSSTTMVLTASQLVIQCNHDTLQIFFSPNIDSIVGYFRYSHSEAIAHLQI